MASTDVKGGETTSAMPLADSSMDYNVLNESTTSSPITVVADRSTIELAKILGLAEVQAEQLLTNGRQGMIDFQNDIAPSVYIQQMSDDSDILRVLKQHFDQQWLLSSEQWLQTFLNEQKRDAPDLYAQILLHTAEYGMKSGNGKSILSLVIQFIFEIDEGTFNNRFDDILKTLITYGQQGLLRYAEHLAPAVMEQQMVSDSSSLCMALHHYYRQPLNDLLKKSKIPDRRNLYDIALACVIVNGWCLGLSNQKVKNLIATNKYNDLRDILKQYLIDNNMDVPDVPDNSVLTEEPITTSQNPAISTKEISISFIQSNTTQMPDQDTIPKQLIESWEPATKKGEH
jgi:hypothetical protein